MTHGAPIFDTNPSEPVAFATKRVEKLTKKYIAGFLEHIETNGLEAPSSGDCWGCSFQIVDGSKHENPEKQFCGPMGIDHILSHFEEPYYVSSLLWRAITLRGYREPSVIWHSIASGQTGFAKDVLRWYFTKIKPYLVKELETTAQMELRCKKGATP